ncbi:hypothetical protein ACFQAV_11355 [Companilactobacillus huachuanensis]|uniref:Uncharacterized protein n=1 Tax=Companilactobacillus huachuanensis TaxID=2559914 RepID=A0ABW1RPW7_9LACO|nr:hypothetical protein [Companilactobacillus huachuanensis]
MNNIQSLRNLKRMTNDSFKKNKRGNIHHIIGGFMLFSSAMGIIIALVSFHTTNWKASLFLLIVYIIMTIIFFLEFMHGSTLKRQSRKNAMQANQLSRMLKSENLPVYYYNNGNNLVHTHFAYTEPFLTEVVLENNLLKIKCDRISLKNREIIINLNQITGINFKDVTLKPGYLNLIINGQTDVNPVASDSTILFFGDGKNYILELKDYLEFYIYQQNNRYWG